MILRNLACVCAVVSAASCATQPATPTADPSLLDAQFVTMRDTICPAPNAPAADDAEPLAVGPTQVFDNLYFLGTRSSSAWALTTSEGIILLDAMWQADVQDVIVDGLASLGLDPADIKYVVITHAHGDHFGGASYLQDAYGAQVVMSPAEWYYLVTWPQRADPAPLPERDLTVLDGDALTLGDTSVRIVVTPGHTPGAVSPMFTVRDGDAEYRVGYWTGASMSFLSPEELEVYIRSIERYQELGAEAGVDVALSNHVFADAADVRMAALATRGPGDPHPFVIGQNGFQRWMETLKGCATTLIAQKRAADSAGAD